MFSLQERTSGKQSLLGVMRIPARYCKQAIIIYLLLSAYCSQVHTERQGQCGPALALIAFWSAFRSSGMQKTSVRSFACSAPAIASPGFFSLPTSIFSPPLFCWLKTTFSLHGNAVICEFCPGFLEWLYFRAHSYRHGFSELLSDTLSNVLTRQL